MISGFRFNSAKCESEIINHTLLNKLFDNQ